MPSRSINLDQIVKDWAWREYDRTATKKQRQLREKERKKNQKYVDVHVDWSEVRFRDETEWPRIAEDSFESDDPNANEGGNVQRAARADQGRTHANTLFQTRFTNNTGEKQEYTMKTEKTTRSTCTTNMETAFTRGIEMSVNLKTPCEVFEANAGYHRELTLTNSEGETLEEELVWGVESQIQVKENHVAEARLVVNEKKYSGDFTIVTRLRGTVYVNFHNIRDNNSLVKATGHDIDEILKEYVDKERRKGVSLDFIEFEDSTAVVKTFGKCTFRYGINQEIKVNQTPLNNA